MARPSPDPAVRASRPLPAAPEYLRNNCARRSGEFEAEGRLEAQIAYGFALAQSRSVLTPYGGFTLGNAGQPHDARGRAVDVRCRCRDDARGDPQQESGGRSCQRSEARRSAAVLNRPHGARRNTAPRSAACGVTDGQGPSHACSAQLMRERHTSSTTETAPRGRGSSRKVARPSVGRRREAQSSSGQAVPGRRECTVPVRRRVLPWSRETHGVGTEPDRRRPTSTRP